MNDIELAKLPRRQQLEPFIPERYTPGNVLDWLQNEIKADPEVKIAWCKKTTEDQKIRASDRVYLLSEAILEMAEALIFFATEGSKEAETAKAIIKLAEGIQV